MTMVMTLKGANQDLLQSPFCAANCHQHMRTNGQGAIMCKSRATHRARITCSMPVRRDNSDNNFVGAEIAGFFCLFVLLLLFCFVLFCLFVVVFWLLLLFVFCLFICLAETDEGGKDTGVPEETPRRLAPKSATY